MEVSVVPHHPSASVLEHHTSRGSTMLSAIGFVHRLSCCLGIVAFSLRWCDVDGILHCDEGWTVSLVEQVLVDERKASMIILVHLVRLLVQTEEGFFVVVKLWTPWEERKGCKPSPVSLGFLILWASVFDFVSLSFWFVRFRSQWQSVGSLCVRAHNLMMTLGGCSCWVE